MNEHNQQSPQYHKGWHSRGYLPHLDVAGVIQGITFRLADSMPGPLLDLWKREAKEKGDRDLVLHRAAKWLDEGHGACHLTDDRIAGVVEKALLHSDGEKYRLLAWVVMPNHVHVLVEMFEGWRMPDIVRMWKSFTARKANETLGRKGPFWQADYFDRYVRDERHLIRTMLYIHENPVKAGLIDNPEDWSYSSANPKWK